MASNETMIIPKASAYPRLNWLTVTFPSIRDPICNGTNAIFPTVNARAVAKAENALAKSNKKQAINDGISSGIPTRNQYCNFDAPRFDALSFHSWRKADNAGVITITMIGI